jgi:hypothetical protein
LSDIKKRNPERPINLEVKADKAEEEGNLQLMRKLCRMAAREYKQVAWEYIVHRGDYRNPCIALQIYHAYLNAERVYLRSGDQELASKYRDLANGARNTLRYYLFGGFSDPL